jgi:hypothetical protein
VGEKNCAHAARLVSSSPISRCRFEPAFKTAIPEQNLTALSTPWKVDSSDGSHYGICGPSGMQNPFLRLKHYRPDQLDPKENHATESLAACLAFSAGFRAGFLTFLYDGTRAPPPQALANPADVEVETQLQTEGFGILDLLLRSGSSGVVVEVKVGAKERDKRHKDQLDNYHLWCTKHLKESALFTLVRDRDPGFAHEALTRRCLWSEFYAYAQKFIAGSDNPTDRALIKALCDYLEMEGVVDNMDYSKLVDYGKGWAAEKAFEGLLRQTTERIERNIDDLTSGSHTKLGESPCLQFGRASWDKHVFGPGFNNKVTVWFCTPVTEGPDCQACEFRFEIQLWNRWHQNDWNFTTKRLAGWLNHLSKPGFEVGAYANRGKWIPWDAGQPLTQANNYVVCPLLAAPSLPVSEDSLRDIGSLASELAKRAEICLRLVDELSPPRG